MHDITSEGPSVGVRPIKQMSHLACFYFPMLCNQVSSKKVLCLEWMKTKVAVVVCISGTVVTAVRTHLTALTPPQFVVTND